MKSGGVYDEEKNPYENEQYYVEGKNHNPTGYLCTHTDVNNK